ncbi:MAG: four-carbon acid sugar kinase family protein [Enterocloster bolteae]
MREITRLPAEELEQKAERDEARIDRILREAVMRSGRKIVVLDDDPTGVQTVHDVSVYTDWSEESVLQGFQEEGNLFYILTNSRGFTEDETKKAHRQIAGNIVKAARATGRDFLIMSRGDSTLRGHYPLETQVLRDVLSREGQQETDGEVICPFLKRGTLYHRKHPLMSDTAGNWCLRGDGICRRQDFWISFFQSG